MGFPRDLAVVGGCGRVGLPLGLAFAEAGLRVVLYDHDEGAVDRVRAGKMPFREEGADAVLERVMGAGTIAASSEPGVLSEADHVVVVVGTPVDEHLNPDPESILRMVDGLVGHLVDGQLLILRSTVYPGVSRMVDQRLRDGGRAIDVAFCPERIAEGRALVELRALPHIVSGCTPRARQRAESLFRRLGAPVVELEVDEAELAKLFTNTWRYVKFAAANQLYMIANDFGLDFERIRAAIAQDYPRAEDMPGPGFAAGPCLLKDTMQLAAFNNNNFTLGQAAMQINEGLPGYIVDTLNSRRPLFGRTVGILGMAFKGESDDTRDSLSYKLKRLLRFRAARVLCTDPYAHSDVDLWPLADVLAESDLLVIATPHKQYADLDVDVRSEERRGGKEGRS